MPARGRTPPEPTEAAGLALPFFLLALFPSYLKKLPRSGGWMARVKVVMSFILAASLKYLSSLDQVLQWGFLHAPQALPGRLDGAFTCWDSCALKASSRMNLWASSGCSRNGLPGLRHHPRAMGAPSEDWTPSVPAAVRAALGRAAPHSIMKRRRGAKASWCWWTSPATPAPSLDEGQHVHAAGDSRSRGRFVLVEL